MAFVIRKTPATRLDVTTYYSLANGKAHWTKIKDVAKSFVKEEDAYSFRGVLANRACHKGLEVVPR